MEEREGGNGPENQEHDVLNRGRQTREIGSGAREEGNEDEATAGSSGGASRGVGAHDGPMREGADGQARRAIRSDNNRRAQTAVATSGGRLHDTGRHTRKGDEPTAMGAEARVLVSRGWDCRAQTVNKGKRVPHARGLSDGHVEPAHVRAARPARPRRKRRFRSDYR